MKKPLYIVLGLALLTAVTIGAHYAYADIYGSSLVMWYTLDSNDISGTTVTDLSGSGANGTTSGSPPLVAGVLGQALKLNGSTQYVTLAASGGGNATPDISTNPISVTAWAYVTSSMIAGSPIQNGILVKLDGEVSTSAYGLLYDGVNTFCTSSRYSQRFMWDIQSGATTYYMPSNQHTTAGWYFVVGTYTANAQHVYVNGKLDDTTLYTSGCGTAAGAPATRSLSTTWPTLLGNASYGAPNAGTIDDVRVYNRALSAAEIQQLYYQGRGSHGYSSF